jgi:hypothetical protein
MVVDPNFSHSGVRESLLTQVHRKPRLITVQVLGGQNDRGVCPMTPHAHWFHANVRLHPICLYVYIICLSGLMGFMGSPSIADRELVYWGPTLIATYDLPS